jgi:fructosamine-3-kinase
LNIWQDIAAGIATHTGEAFEAQEPQGLAGGCINSAFRLSDGRRTFFVKTNRADRLDMFEAEAAGLNLLADSATLRVPRALFTGAGDGLSYIVMEHVALGHGSSQGWRLAGEQLAAMHGHQAGAFGWDRDNTIGATPQRNDWTSDWIEFWRVHRLGRQLEIAAANGHLGQLQRLGERLMARFAVLIDHGPSPSLLHGDLWGGNLAFTDDGDPVIYDPATYYGDREADLAMTELFGGFSPDFYAAYRDAWPLEPGYETRRTLYNLYHILNHLNLFGGGYGGQAQRMMERLLAEC